MCNFKSGLIFKNRVILTPDGNESHSDLLDSLKIEDSRENAMRKFIRAELTPPNGDKKLPVDKWVFKVDQDITPDWYSEDPVRYETEFRYAVKEYMKKFVEIAGYLWQPIKQDGNRIYYLMYEPLMKSDFGKNNNYATSYIREKLNNSDLAKQLKETFGDKLVPIRTDLLSFDGLDDYGKVEGDILAIPTIDLYRECGKNIEKINELWWLATPDSTPSGCGSDYVSYVTYNGVVYCCWYDDVRGVRCFFILES